MTVDKAIQILTSLLADRQDLVALDLGTAIKLGIEALKAVREYQQSSSHRLLIKLPGETET